jgi:hypothetical protein
LGLGVSAALVLLARFEIMRLEGMADKARIQEAAENPPPVKQGIAAATAPVAPANATPVAAVQPPPTPAPPPAPAKTAFDLLKLEAIFFTSQHPSALISGKLAVVNEEVADCRVLDISPSSVTLGHQDQRKVLVLR